jgi:serine/threonine protein kinase
MDAGALSTLLAKRRTIPERCLACITWQVCDGLEYLHREMHVIHRDIKPANLLLNGHGLVKITDFGVSGELGDDVGQKNKSTWVGTIYYMSPERVRGGKYAFDSDMWSLGLTLIECCSGTYPYLNQSNQTEKHKLSVWELMRCIDTMEPPRLEPAWGHSRALGEFVGAILQKEPMRRPSAAIMKAHSWLVDHACSQIELAAWIAEVMDYASYRNSEIEKIGDFADKDELSAHISVSRASLGQSLRGRNPFPQASGRDTSDLLAQPLRGSSPWRSSPCSASVSD